MSESPPPPEKARRNIAAGGCAVPVAAIIMSVMIALGMGMGSVPALVPFVTIVTLLIACIVGLPIYLLISYWGRVDWRTVSAGGFVTGAIVPAIIFLCGPAQDEQSIAGVATVSGRAYTLGAWLDNAGIVALFGLAGIIGALIAWYFVSARSRDAADRERVWRYRGWAALAVVASLAASTSVPWLVSDRSCHNQLRDGRTGIAPAASFEVHVSVAARPAVQRQIEAFGRVRGWSVQSYVNAATGWFDVDICTEPGTAISTMALGRDDTLSVVIYQPQGGDSWQEPFHALDRQIAARWPGAVVYDPASANPPPWAPPVSPPAPSSATR